MSGSREFEKRPPRFPKMQSTGELVRETEKRVCRAVWETMDELADIRGVPEDALELVRIRLEEALAYGPHECDADTRRRS
jgi:hypothetical protein